MRADYVIVGTGLAAVGAAKALIEKGFKPTILDSGKTLPGRLDSIKNKLKEVDLEDWNESEANIITNNLLEKGNFFSIPKKLVFGSDFFIGSHAEDYKLKIEDKMVPPFSRAFGGLSNGWGAASLPISKHDACNWPIDYKELLYHYKEVLADIPFSGASDGLDEEFPLLKKDISSLELSPQDNWLINALKKGRPIQKGSYIFGQARILAQNTSNPLQQCRYCSLCESGCKYGSVYKASDSFLKWINEGKINYIPGVIVKSYSEIEDGQVILNFKDKNSELKKISCNKAFVAAGAVPSSRIFLESNNNKGLKMKIKTRGGYVLPVWRIKSFKNKKNLNSEPGVFIELKGGGLKNWAHVQVSSSNDLLEERLSKGFLSLPLINIFARFILRHLVILLVNFHSNHSGRYEISLDKENDLMVTNYKSNKTFSLNLISSFIHITRTILPIGMIPIPFFRTNSGTYHVGASMPMKKEPKNFFETDTEGKPINIKNLHFIDSSIFPDLPGTTIGILSMANAHRIATNIFKNK